MTSSAFKILPTSTGTPNAFRKAYINSKHGCSWKRYALLEYIEVLIDTRFSNLVLCMRKSETENPVSQTEILIISNLTSPSSSLILDVWKTRGVIGNELSWYRLCRFQFFKSRFFAHEYFSKSDVSQLKIVYGWFQFFTSRRFASQYPLQRSFFFSKVGDPRRKSTICCSLKRKTLWKTHTKVNIISTLKCCG